MTNKRESITFSVVGHDRAALSTAAIKQMALFTGQPINSLANVSPDTSIQSTEFIAYDSTGDTYYVATVTIESDI